jgi:hypothetical protein
MNERGTYGNGNGDAKPGSWKSGAIVVGIAAALYLMSPGTRHWYKYGRLP